MRDRTRWLTVVGLLFACGITEPVPGPTDLYVRNASPFTMESLVVNGWNIGDLASGGIAGPQTFGTVYHYGAIFTVVDGDSLRLQPIDFVGEEPLGRGAFTYVLTVGGDSLQRWISIEAVSGAPE